MSKAPETDTFVKQRFEVHGKYTPTDVRKQLAQMERERNEARMNERQPSIATDAPAKELTIEKVQQCMIRCGSKITGYVLTDKHGDVAIIDKSAVRWLGANEMWWLMHDSESPIEVAPKDASDATAARI